MSATIMELTERTFASAVADGTVLVDFWAPWCMPCQMQGVILNRLAGQLQAKAVVAKVNVDEFPGLAQQFSINGIPALLLFKEGRLVQRFVGVQNERTLLAAIEAAA